MTVLFGMGPTGPSLEELKQAHHLASDKGPCLVERALLIEVLRKEHDRRDRHVEDSGIALDDVQRGRLQAAFDFRQIRSEEHTSELQSLMRISYAVFCLKTKTQILVQHKHSRSKVK